MRRLCGVRASSRDQAALSAMSRAMNEANGLSFHCCGGGTAPNERRNAVVQRAHGVSTHSSMLLT